MRDRVLALDLGTTSVKAGLLDGRSVIAEASVRYPMARPAPRAAEQDPDAWWRAAVRASASLPDLASVDAVVVTGHAHCPPGAAPKPRIRCRRGCVPAGW